MDGCRQEPPAILHHLGRRPFVLRPRHVAVEQRGRWRQVPLHWFRAAPGRAHDAQITRVRQLEHVPAQWTQEDATNVLTGTFADLYFLNRRKSGRGLCTFTFRATSPADIDVHPFVVSTDENTLTYWANIAPPRNLPKKEQQVRTSPTVT